MNKTAIIGAGSWGTALAVTLAENCPNVLLWSRRKELCRTINETRVNQDYLPGVTIPSNVTLTADLEEAVRQKDMLALVVPSHTVRDMARQIAPYTKKETIVISCAKGLEEKTYQRMTQILQEELPHCHAAVLSGPNHAEEVGRKIPSATVVSAQKRQVAEAAQDLFMTRFLRVYTNPDVVGVELGGALKNIIALGAGIADGLGFGDNTIAALMTRGISEIARLGIAMGADPLTFAGLSGIGDLMVTCTSRHSRNRSLGVELGKGKKLSEVLAGMHMVAEGVRTTRTAWELAQQYGVEMPITNQAYNVLFEEKDPRAAVVDLMRRGRTHETEDIVSDKYETW
ncbi:NAD(P)H-dependent glycerol-3-phosphate dehydrogenase [Dethiobacter alkaliphilus]|uniref:NAD(P)H-dependent glycerol-3-phosphate dehydrogenase n=1 Tax=Dethiobacter alkaliphilus TaxID=427926 RepID=UPI002226F40F|nr:NAD(P)H-dependent glycerol-3-phosphate dehydrogenase [Dethiobacter alkaliphilus]MCW3491512.1 NAD(P)H-dependent glycerol-3-phosphate dehydrogenase [Dethiobacter alkaliphilus]